MLVFNPVIAVVLYFMHKTVATGTTDFLGCLTIVAFNPLNARKYLSSRKLYDLSNWS